MDVDAIIVGTGLTESIVAAALSKAGYSIAHVDENSYYGGDDASLTLDELVDWADRHAATDAGDGAYTYAQRARFTSISRSQTTLPKSRQYSISLVPTVIPSIGPFIDSLIASGVSRYGGFKLLEKAALYDGAGRVTAVPGGKEDVFKNKALSLIDKRRLMRFLMFAAGEFEDKPELQGNEHTPLPVFLREKFSISGQSAEAITYALAFCTAASDPTLPGLQRIRQYLRSSGRYGPSPFLIGHYGGLGEIAQGFCRTAAVNGATYVLGRKVSSLAPLSESERASSGKRYSVQLEDLDEAIRGDVIIAAADYVPPAFAASDGDRQAARTSYARGIAIIDQPISFTVPDAQPEPPTHENLDEAAEPASSPTVDTALLVFPPGSVPGGSTTGAAQVLISGEASLAAPAGKWILHITLPLPAETARETTAEDALRPYLDATLTLATSPSPSPLFTLYYIEHAPPSPSSSALELLLVTPPRAAELDQTADAATVRAEDVFWKAVSALRALRRRPRRRDGEGEGEEGVELDGEVDAFWPPLDAPLDDGDDW